MLEILETRKLKFTINDLEFGLVNCEDGGILYDWDNAEIINTKMVLSNGLIDIKLHCKSDVYINNNLAGEIEFIILIDGVDHTNLEGKFYDQFVNEIQFNAKSTKFKIYKQLIEDFFRKGWTFFVYEELESLKIHSNDTLE